MGFEVAQIQSIAGGVLPSFPTSLIPHNYWGAPAPIGQKQGTRPPTKNTRHFATAKFIVSIDVAFSQNDSAISDKLLLILPMAFLLK